MMLEPTGVLAAEPSLAMDVVAASVPVQPAAEAVQFEVFHYNGLEGGGAGSTRRACVTKGAISKPVENAIGTFAPLELPSQPNMGGVAAVDEVLRTKWASARVDWHDSAPPSID